MVAIKPDFRKILSPKTRAEGKAHLERILAFQDMDRRNMAKSLLEASRTLVDAGPLKPEHPFNKWGDDEWVLYRYIPALAVCLDPSVELRDVETPKPEERWDPVSDSRAGKPEGLFRSIELVFGRDLFLRARIDLQAEVRLAAKFLQDHHGRVSAIGVAVDVLEPGFCPGRQTPDTRPPLEGAQLVATHGDHDRVERYSEAAADLEGLFEAAAIKRQRGQLSSEQESRLHELRSWPERLDFDALSIQACDGTVLREQRFTVEDEPLPTPEM